MAEYDSIDLLNYAMYGNDYDSEWDEIRAVLKTNVQAQKELEELKKNLPAPTKKKREFFQEREPAQQTPFIPTESGGPQSASNKKSWWKGLIGD